MCGRKPERFDERRLRARMPDHREDVEQEGPAARRHVGRPERPHDRVAHLGMEREERHGTREPALLLGQAAHATERSQILGQALESQPLRLLLEQLAGGEGIVEVLIGPHDVEPGRRLACGERGDALQRQRKAGAAGEHRRSVAFDGQRRAIVE